MNDLDLSQDELSGNIDDWKDELNDDAHEQNSYSDAGMNSCISLAADMDAEDSQTDEMNDPQDVVTGDGYREPIINISRFPESDLDDYEDYTYLTQHLREIIGEARGLDGEIQYNVLFEDEHVETLTTDKIHELEGGKLALNLFKKSSKVTEEDLDFESAAEEIVMTSTRPGSKRIRDPYFTTIDEFSDDDDDLIGTRRSKRLRQTYYSDDDDDDINDHPRRKLRQTILQTTGKGLRSRNRFNPTAHSSEDEEEEEEDMYSLLKSDVVSETRKSRRYAGRRGKNNDDYARPVLRPQPPRQSGRSTRHQGLMLEVGEDIIHRIDSEPRSAGPPKAMGAREVFKTLPRTDPFRERHVQQCETCNNGSNIAPLIYCQGCAFAYHKNCLGQRAAREHLVTKVAEDDFILQCKRCVRYAQKKDATAPDQSRCFDCKITGRSCTPFRSRKTTLQEQKDREANQGVDPVFIVAPELINNADNIMFRCVNCFRAAHFEHLPSTRGDILSADPETAATSRFNEYSTLQSWRCKECSDAGGKLKGLVAWKPVDEELYDPTKALDEICEDDKVYLVRWENKSYFRCTWMPGPWVWGVTQMGASMRKAFGRRDDTQVPKMTIEDAIPEEYLRVDIVLDIRYTSKVDVEGDDIDKARIREVKEALVKYKGLGYEEVVWEVPPPPEDQERWTDFVTAYNDWVLGKYTHLPKTVPLQTRLVKARESNFATKLEKKKQPDNLIGGQLMKYQLDGLNWLYYKWHSKQNAILADEMGLGKTIQIIGLLATLVSDWNCFPFLIVVPNATCANWRREIKQWAPSLRTVAYFGSQAAREYAYNYELYPRNGKELRCHIVVISYEAAQDEGSRKFFRSVPWQGLIVDEGQRLKSDKTILYNALSALKIPFRILLTGTPLQNNARELFNLLQFLDPSFDAVAMELEYQNLDNEKVARLHELIRPYFLRRTKAQVLTFLPPMAQIILPVSMPIVQKKLYRSILAKNPDLLRALFRDKNDVKSSERASLNNILMQLRKCLAHPFVYSQSIEERVASHQVSHRNLVEASGKFQLLETLLPKLKERGHRVLIFSQFLDMLTMTEDLLEGLGMTYHRLDGTMSSLQKQKRIDSYNAPNSEYFAFLLSTRAGGVGINLATADTVIILDPDFNPHQDLQATSRAHRIGQKNKVLCFQIVTRASAEEKIMQIGRKKMALDHVLIEQMDAEDATDQDLSSILRYGAAEIFSDNGEKDIKYSSDDIEKLLDRSQIENIKVGDDKSAESQFSTARVWATNDEFKDTVNSLGEENEIAPDATFWDKILKDRERIAAAEAAAVKAALGRGRRAKQSVDYTSKRTNEVLEDHLDQEGELDQDVIPLGVRKQVADDPESDTDFKAGSDIEPDQDDEADQGEVDAMDLDDEIGDNNSNTVKEPSSQMKKKVVGQNQKKEFHRVHIPPIPLLFSSPLPQHLQPAISHTLPPNGIPTPPRSLDIPTPTFISTMTDTPANFRCPACLGTLHPIGSCPLKMVGVEYCNLCGMAHYGHGRTCPHISSETQVRLMLDALKNSQEAGSMVELARRYLRGVKGDIIRKKSCGTGHDHNEETSKNGEESRI